MTLTRILLKSDQGEYEGYNLSPGSLLKWFEDNSDEEGNVTKDIVIFQDCCFKILDDGTINWVLSDYSLDRDIERIDPKGWVLTKFKKNPIVLWSHDHMRPAIGKVISPRVKEAKLIGKVKFSSKEVDEFAAMIEGKVREGIINAGSVGFKSMKVELIDDKDEDAELIYRKQELYEFSIVNIPSNTNAMAERNIELEDDNPELTELQHRVAMLEKKNKSNNYIEGLFKDTGRETSGVKKVSENMRDFFGSDDPETRESETTSKEDNSMSKFFNLEVKNG